MATHVPPALQIVISALIPQHVSDAIGAIYSKMITPVVKTVLQKDVQFVLKMIALYAKWLNLVMGLKLMGVL